MVNLRRYAAAALTSSLLCVPLLLVSCGRQGTGNGSADNQLKELLSEEWEYELKSSPETATALGDNRYNAELSDYSPAWFAQDAERNRTLLDQFQHVDPDKLTAENVLNRTLMIRRLRDKIEAYTLKDWEMPVDQMNGVQIGLAALPGYTRFANAHDYDDYVSRLHKYPKAFEQIEDDLRMGVKDHLVQPKYLLEKVATQTQQIADAPVNKSPFAIPIQKFPDGITEGDRKRITSTVKDVIEKDVAPAYRKFAKFVREDYAPHGRTDPGIWSLPDGDARYRRAVRVMTTTELSPEQFHEIGLKQVDAIEKEMLSLANKLGFHDLASLKKDIESTKRFYATSGQQILDLYKSYIDQMRPEMPKLFGHQPKAQLNVVPMEAFREKGAPPADYSPGATDGSRPARINVNESDPTRRLTINIEAVAYHEGIPGHHQQIALAQEMKGLPEFRRNAGYNAFVEGWALYAEQLGKEVGFYKDPYSDYGRLENEMWRAVRLVVDTGVHYKHWTRDQMVDYFRAHTSLDEPSIQSEVDRYIAWPGQALAYKAGQIKILELRERAKKELGPRFDLRAFHDAVLGEGALPLDVLEARMDGWINRQKT
ncbi:MAG TPA: DUF885 domain-containing protein [Bryobacteraceae bacterium]|nr:DUF885 domain-containing protein [Bryobacteraceae bacterium]